VKKEEIKETTYIRGVRTELLNIRKIGGGRGGAIGGKKETSGYSLKREKKEGNQAGGRKRKGFNGPRNAYGRGCCPDFDNHRSRRVPSHVREIKGVGKKNASLGRVEPISGR